MTCDFSNEGFFWGIVAHISRLPANGKRQTITEYLTKIFTFIIKINLIPIWPQVFLQF